MGRNGLLPSIRLSHARLPSADWESQSTVHVYVHRHFHTIAIELPQHPLATITVAERVMCESTRRASLLLAGMHQQDQQGDQQHKVARVSCGTLLVRYNATTGPTNVFMQDSNTVW